MPPQDPRDRRIAELERTLDVVLRKLAELEAENAALRAENAALQAKVTELEARLNTNSSNSSRPPSSDPPWTQLARKRGQPGQRRKRGGQPGHQGHHRERLEPQAVVDLLPGRCAACRRLLPGRDPQPAWHQVVDLVDGRSVVTEYRLHRRRCRCGATTRALLPPGVPTGAFGPTLLALVALLTGKYRLSKRAVQELLHDLHHVRVSLGAIARVERTVSAALAAPVAAVEAQVHKAPVVHADETGWREGTRRAWLWVAVAAHLAVFRISRSRGAQVAKELLGAAFRGFLVSDQWSGYTWVDHKRRQLCWAHLLRKFQGWIDRGGEAARVGRRLRRLAKQMFAWWFRVRDGTLSHRTFQRRMERRVIPAFTEALDVAACGSAPGVARPCHDLFMMSEALWTFVRHPGIEPTNNAAERALRHAVIWRRSSLGTQSEVGSRFVERILTTVTTLRLQERKVFDYLIRACQHHLLGIAAPSLLPDCAPGATLPAAA